MEKLFTIPEVAEILKTCTETIRRRVRRGEIPAVKEPGRNGRFLIYEKDLINYLKSFEI